MSEQYRWDNAHEWLAYKLARGEITYEEAWKALYDKVDDEMIQDVFEKEMDRDGYFNKQDEDEVEDEEVLPPNWMDDLTGEEHEAD